MAAAGDAAERPHRRRVGIVGFGHLGQYMYDAIRDRPELAAALEVVFVWNRTADKLAGVPAALVCSELSEVARFRPDVIVEVAHPMIAAEFGELFVRTADFIVGSPTAFADAAVEARIRAAASEAHGHGVYIPSGALWGAQDIAKMAKLGTLKGLTVCMKKHPASFKVLGRLKPVNDRLVEEGDTKGEVVLFEGPVRELCPLAPNNVNTMAAAALAASNLGFDKVVGKLVADSTLSAHVIQIDVLGPGSGADQFYVSTTRFNPAVTGQVTGSATFDSFLASLLLAHNQGSGVHMC